MSMIPMSAAAISNYVGMDALVGVDDKVYLGKRENYHFAPSTPTEPGEAYYDDLDGSLQFISDNVTMFHFLYGEGWTLPQRQMRREHCFTKADYIEFAQLRDGVLTRYPLIHEVTFAGQPFVPPKAYRRTRGKERPVKRSPNRTAFR